MAPAPEFVAFPIPWKLTSLGQVSSTNTLLMEQAHRELLANEPLGALHGLAYLAESQTAGRGQYQRTWSSPPGGLYLSGLVEMLPEALRPRLALLAGLSVLRWLQREGLPAKLRWPNDLVLGGKKVCGILCEGQALGDRCAHVIGIGLNLNVAVADLSPELQGFATSLLHEDGRRRPVQHTAISLLESLSQTLAGIAQGHDGKWIEELQSFNALAAKRVELETREGKVTGQVMGLSHEGALELESSEGLKRIIQGSLLSIEGQAIRPVG